jgi:hypothetical protein|tara:strand:- start:2623 stop:2889 length:267 start_codon:yes stop_codon:yes gene_type:complete
MGIKHAKKRFFIVRYNIKPDGKFDEFVELSKKKVGPGKIKDSRVVLDLLNEEVVKCDLPNVPVDIPYENVYKHYRKWYADVIDQFVGS